MNVFAGVAGLPGRFAIRGHSFHDARACTVNLRDLICLIMASCRTFWGRYRGADSDGSLTLSYLIESVGTIQRFCFLRQCVPYVARIPKPANSLGLPQPHSPDARNLPRLSDAEAPTRGQSRGGIRAISLPDSTGEGRNMRIAFRSQKSWGFFKKLMTASKPRKWRKLASESDLILADQRAKRLPLPSAFPDQ
jgi:hypothetical protein